MNELLKKDLEIIIKSVKELNLTLFLHAGTLLGAIREKDFIAHDHDFDFGVFKSEFDDEMRQKLINKLTNEQKLEFKGYEAKCFDNFIERTEFGIRPHVVKFWSANAHWNTDFWIFEKRENDYYHKGWGGYFYFLKETLDTLDEIEFLGLKVLVPHNPELFLEHLYGKDWRIPKQYSSKDKTPGYPNWNKILK